MSQQWLGTRNISKENGKFQCVHASQLIEILLYELKFEDKEGTYEGTSDFR